MKQTTQPIDKKLDEILEPFEHSFLKRDFDGSTFCIKCDAFAKLSCMRTNDELGKAKEAILNHTRTIKQIEKSKGKKK